MKNLIRLISALFILVVAQGVFAIPREKSPEEVRALLSKDTAAAILVFSKESQAALADLNQKCSFRMEQNQKDSQFFYIETAGGLVLRTLLLHNARPVVVVMDAEEAAYVRNEYSNFLGSGIVAFEYEDDKLRSVEINLTSTKLTCAIPRDGN